MRGKKASNLSSLLEDTPLTYYWVGFLLADGSFREKRLKLELKEGDTDHVERFARFVQYSGDRRHKHALLATDAILVPAIREKFKIQNRKTYHPASINWIKDHRLLLSLIAGFIDGDGCIRRLHKRQDSHIIIRLHASWLGVLNEMREAIERGVQLLASIRLP